MFHYPSSRGDCASQLGGGREANQNFFSYPKTTWERFTWKHESELYLLANAVLDFNSL